MIFNQSSRGSQVAAGSRSYKDTMINRCEHKNPGICRLPEFGAGFSAHQRYLNEPCFTSSRTALT